MENKIWVTIADFLGSEFHSDLHAILHSQSSYLWSDTERSVEEKWINLKIQEIERTI